MVNPELEHLFDIPLRIEACVPGPMMRVADLLALSVGGVVGAARAAGETVDVVAGGALIGAGEISGSNGCRSLRMVSFKSPG